MFSPLAPQFAIAQGFPPAPAVHSAIIGWFVLLFGCAYGWMAWTNRANRMVIALACGGKATFAGTLFWYGFTGDLAVMTALAGMPDLVLAGIFAYWLIATPADPAA